MIALRTSLRALSAVRRAWPIAAAAAIVLLAGWFTAMTDHVADAGTAPCAPATQVFLATPEADSWFEIDIGTGAPVNSTPQGASRSLEAGWSDVGTDQHAILQFALPTLPPAHVVESAELELGVRQAGIYTFDPPEPVSGTIVIHLRRVLEPWDEVTTTSLDAPELSADVLRTEIRWGPCGPDDCGTAKVDVTQHVRGWMAQGWPNHGLALHAKGVLASRPIMGTFYIVGSRESERPPVLQIVQVGDDDQATPTATAVVPTPGDPSYAWLPAVFASAASADEPTQEPTSAPRSPTPTMVRHTATPVPMPTAGTPHTPTATHTPGVAPPDIEIVRGEVDSPDVAGEAASSCGHLVVWRETSTNDGAISGRFVRPEELDDPFLISAGAGAQGAPSVAYNAVTARWLVVWPAPHPDSVSAIRGQRVSCAGLEGDTIAVGRYPLIEDQPSVASADDGFAVVLRRSFSGRPDHQLVGTFVAGVEPPDAQLLGDPGDVAEPAVACRTGSDCLVAWTDDAGTYGSSDVLARAWSPVSGTVGAGLMPIGDVENMSERQPAVASVTDAEMPGFVVAWVRHARYAKVLARSVVESARDPEKPYGLGPELEISMTLGGSGSPDLATGDDRHAVAYAMGPPHRPAPDIAVRAVGHGPAGLELVASDRVVLSEDDVQSGVPAVAMVSPTDALVVWQDGMWEPPHRIVARFVSLP